MILDLDHFKTLNDTCGHEAGNKCLRHVAACLRDTLRTSDLIARFGGDEFEVLLPDTSPVNAVRVAEKIRNVICRLKFAKNVRIAATLGVAGYPEHAGDAHLLF